MKLAPTKLVTKDVIISVDTMGGDRGAAVFIDGMKQAAQKYPNIGFIVHGDEAIITQHIKKHNLIDICDIRHCQHSISMDIKPIQALRQSKGSSMWSAINAVKNNEAAVALSCGNTGALMAIAMMNLRKITGVHRPAIAALWPSKNLYGHNIILDMGADIRAEAKDLLHYALMGTSYARNGFNIQTPRVGLLNVGVEKYKGDATLKKAHEMISAHCSDNCYKFVGFIEGCDIISDKVDVIITDGFSGNIALKTTEGVAAFIRDSIQESFKHSVFSRFSALVAYHSLRRLKKRIDPRRFNGGVFLGLNGTVIKSHGDADTISIQAAIDLAYRLVKLNFSKKISMNIKNTLKRSTSKRIIK